MCGCLGDKDCACYDFLSFSAVLSYLSRGRQFFVDTFVKVVNFFRRI